MNTYNQDWFRDQSISILKNQAQTLTYTGYPSFENRLHGKPDAAHVLAALHTVTGPQFAARAKDLPLPDAHQQSQFKQQGLRLDPLGRPLHPWFDQMVAQPGAALGSGYYWYWGANVAADSLAVRNDLDEPHLLIGDRVDTGKPAFLAGMNEGEPTLETAYRENGEEARVEVFDLRAVAHSVHKVYQGPLADLRATAHAWPTTTAYLFNITEPVTTPMEWEGKSDEVERVYWQPFSKLGDMFGSHRLIAELAVRVHANLRA